MIFDRICRLVERCPELFRPLRPVIEAAHLFHFPHVPGEVLPKNYADDALAFHTEHFVLPFRTVAIEDESSCVVLWDANANAAGLGARRFYFEFAPLSAKHASTWRDAEEEMAHRETMRREDREQLDRLSQVTFGTIWNLGSVPLSEADPRPEDPDRNWRYNVETTLIGAWVLNGDDVDMELSAPMMTQHLEGVCAQGARNAITAIEEFMQFNAPDRFILEDRPLKERKKTPKILRSGDRPLYTLLHPAEIRSKLKLPEPERGGPRKPHERRRHVRRYPDDIERWPNMHGKSIVIPASWVGPSEATVGKRRYKVLLDQ